MNTCFPNPADHAAVMLNACGTIEAACSAAEINRDFAATDKDFRYWSLVHEALEIRWAEIFFCMEASCRAN